jgi:hypothetical protein
MKNFGKYIAVPALAALMLVLGFVASCCFSSCNMIDKDGDATFIGNVISETGKYFPTNTAVSNKPPVVTSNTPPVTVPSGLEPTGEKAFNGELIYRNAEGTKVFADGSRAKWNEPRKCWSRDVQADNFILYPPTWKGTTPTGSGMYETANQGLCFTGPEAGAYWLFTNGVWVKQPVGVIPAPKTY